MVCPADTLLGSMEIGVETKDSAEDLAEDSAAEDSSAEDSGNNLAEDTAEADSTKVNAEDGREGDEEGGEEEEEARGLTTMVRTQLIKDVIMFLAALIILLTAVFSILLLKVIPDMSHPRPLPLLPLLLTPYHGMRQDHLLANLLFLLQEDRVLHMTPADQ